MSLERVIEKISRLDGTNLSELFSVGTDLLVEIDSINEPERKKSALVVALRIFDCLIQITPKGAILRLYRGHIHALLGKSKKAIRDCNATLEARPQNGVGYFACIVGGYAHCRLGHFETAIGYYKRAIKLCPREALPYRNKTFCHLLLNKNLDEALDDLESGIENFRGKDARTILGFSEWVRARKQLNNSRWDLFRRHMTAMAAILNDIKDPLWGYVKHAIDSWYFGEQLEYATVTLEPSQAFRRIGESLYDILSKPPPVLPKIEAIMLSVRIASFYILFRFLRSFLRVCENTDLAQVEGNVAAICNYSAEVQTDCESIGFHVGKRTLMELEDAIRRAGIRMVREIKKCPPSLRREKAREKLTVSWVKLRSGIMLLSGPLTRPAKAITLQRIYAEASEARRILEKAVAGREGWQEDPREVVSGPKGRGKKREVKEPTVGVYFHRTIVQMAEGEMFRKPVNGYPWRLLELLLQRERVHWTYGFLIFGKWRSDPGPDNPKKTMNEYISTLKGKTKDSLSHNKIPIEIEKDTETGEVYLKEYDHSKFSSNIFSAEERVKKVKDMLAKGDSEELGDVRKALADIIDGKEGYYNCYEAYKLLIQYLEKTGFKKEDERLITKVGEFFEERILVYEESFYAIEVHREKTPQTYYWKGTDEAIDIMREELRELEECHKIIAPYATKRSVSEDFSDIIRLIGEINNLEPPYEPPLKKKAFEELAHKHSVRSMLNSVILQIPKDKRLRNLSREDIELAILPNFARTIIRVRTRHFQSLPPLIEYLKTSTEQRTREELIEREYGIPANVQRDIRRKSKIQRDLIQKPGHKFRDDEVYKKLGWSKEKQREIRMHESKLWNVPGFNEQQYKGEIP